MPGAGTTSNSRLRSYHGQRVNAKEDQTRTQPLRGALWCRSLTNIRTPSHRPAQLGNRRLPNCPLCQMGNNWLPKFPGAHNVLLIQRVKEPAARLWYMQQTLANGWGRNVLLVMIKSGAHRRQGQSITNFEQGLPATQSDLVQQTLKDPCIFDFLTLEEPFHERELETSLLHQLERFLLELGHGFAFVGRQFCLKVGEDEFYELTRALPLSLKSVLPTVEEIEAELSESATAQVSLPKAGKKASETKKPAKKKPKKGCDE